MSGMPILGVLPRSSSRSTTGGLTVVAGSTRRVSGASAPGWLIAQLSPLLHHRPKDGIPVARTKGRRVAARRAIRAI